MTDANREAVEALAVTPDQERSVSGVRESILEAAEEPDAQSLFTGRFAPAGDLLADTPSHGSTA
jgi:hypothetical protein